MKKILFINLLFALLSQQLYSKPEREQKHVVKKGETLYSISRAYGLKVKDIVKINPGLSSNPNIKPGQQLYIPGSVPVNIHKKPTETAKASKPKHVVVPSTPDTPYKDEDDRTRKLVPESVATTSQPAATNELIVNDKPVEVKEAVFSLRTSSANAADYPDIYSHYSSHGYTERKNKGEASFLDENTSGNPYLALYNDAVTGSLIRVTSLMNQKTVYVKIVGKVSAADARNEVMIKLSNQVATELGASGSKFLVEVSGYSAN